jgi:predicted DNA-binding antitoxin AbrB/MazE fold protein
MTVRAVYKNGVFQPIEPVKLPEDLQVEVIVPGDRASHTSTEPMKRIYNILSRSYDTGQTDLAQRHNEHQP